MGVEGQENGHGRGGDAHRVDEDEAESLFGTGLIRNQTRMLFKSTVFGACLRGGVGVTRFV